MLAPRSSSRSPGSLRPSQAAGRGAGGRAAPRAREGGSLGGGAAKDSTLGTKIYGWVGCGTNGVGF